MEQYRGGAEGRFDDEDFKVEPETERVSFTAVTPVSPVHVQDGSASGADVTDDHGRWESTLSMLRHQRHVDVELLKIFQNETTESKLFGWMINYYFISNTLNQNKRL